MACAGTAADPIDDAFFARGAVAVARDLVGATLRFGRLAARIVETEAYAGDPASHFVTRPRTAAMMGTTFGRLYIYRIYGLHRCLNVTADRNGPGAVLLRALEPIEGVAEMARRRGVTDPRQIASGPAKLFVALGIGDDLLGARALDEFTFERPARPPRVASGPRIGISRAKSLRWRFWERGNPHVSR
ncbi:MAG: putative 3-methyladenine DNA glycosylase [Planctomycetes bacterium]|nr:putative 3-methyladenine DNA glycosylase [Planctomycetota bacterium]